MRKPRKTSKAERAEFLQQRIGMAKLVQGKELPVKTYPLSVLMELKPKRERVKSPEPTEAKILKSILAYLRTRPDVAWCCRINSGTFVDGDRYIAANSQRGMSDIIGMMHGGRLLAIEVKSAKGKLLDHQRDFLHMIAYGGGIAGVARSIDDVQLLIEEFKK